MLSPARFQSRSIYRLGRRVDMQKREIASSTSRNARLLAIVALNLAIPLTLGACQSAQTRTEIIPSAAPTSTVECDELEGRYRVLDAATEEFFEKNEGRELAFGITYGLDGEIMRWRIEDAKCLRVEENLPLQVLRKLEPIALFVIKHEGNTDVCAGDQSGGTGGAVCPNH
jgi:hypothetical protein